MITVLKPYLLIGLGSALGGMGRFWISTLLARRFGEGFPVGTLVANVSGCLLIGIAAAYTLENGRLQITTPIQQFLMIGLLGGYTTFSTFSLQTLNLAKDGQLTMAGLNVALSVVSCLIAVWLGLTAGAALNR
ncbi:MAG: CrcB protein [Candidatus Binatia bacterium]|jgi:CrcB protein